MYTFVFFEKNFRVLTEQGTCCCDFQNGQGRAPGKWGGDGLDENELQYPSGRKRSMTCPLELNGKWSLQTAAARGFGRCNAHNRRQPLVQPTALLQRTHGPTRRPADR